jgi:hypothetical protein
MPKAAAAANSPLNFNDPYGMKSAALTIERSDVLN